MDRHFLEFWGNLFINAAKSQKHLEDMSRWVNQGFSGFEELRVMFGKFYGLDTLKKDEADSEMEWQKAAAAFQDSFNQYLQLMGAVPGVEHRALVKKYEDLRKKVAEQEEIIKYLRMILDKKGFNQGELLRGFEELMKKQTDQFQDLVKDFGNPLKKTPSVNS